MVKIRLLRIGRKHETHYRIVAADSRFFRSSKCLEQIGYYNPSTHPSTLEYDKEILKKWMDRGAQMSDTVNDLFVKEGVLKQNVHRKKRIQTVIVESKKRAKESEPKPEEKPVTPTDTAGPEQPAETAPSEVNPEVGPTDHKDTEAQTVETETKQDDKPSKKTTDEKQVPEVQDPNPTEIKASA